MISPPPPVLPDESPTVAAARLDKAATDLTTVGDELAARAAAFHDRARECRTYAAELRAGAR